MTEEYYGKNIFGETVNFGLDLPAQAGEPEEAEASMARGQEFNIFALTDAIGARDKRGAWVIYEKALASGITADEIFYRIFWGVKSLILSAKCESAEEAGLNPFVYKKSKSFLKNWPVSELEKLLEDLVVGYHEARRGRGEVETMIEKILLRI